MFIRNICFIAFSLVPGYPQVFACRHYLLQKCNTFWRSNPKENLLSLKEQIIFQRQDLTWQIFKLNGGYVFHDHSNIFLLSAEQSIACFPFLSCRLLYRNDQPI